MTKILNAQIKYTKLGYYESPIFTFYLGLDLQDGGGVCVGGYAMDAYSVIKDERVGTAYGMDVIKRILEVVGVHNWEELEGKYIRVESEGIGSKVTKIGNLMKDEWVDFGTYYNEVTRGCEIPEFKEE